MKLYVKYDIDAICTAALKKQLDSLNLRYRISSFNEVELLEALPEARHEELFVLLEKEGIYIVGDTQAKLAHRIKDAITDMVYSYSGQAQRQNVSAYLSQKLNYSYNHLSDVFSQTTLGSIENFVILKKIDYAKKLIIEGNLSFSEIAFKLGYSSSSHLSNQFKRTTGLTPSNFKRLIKERKAQRLRHAQSCE